MKSLRPLLLLVTIYFAISSASFSQITMTFPKAISYVNNIPVGWSTSSPPASIQMIWTYKSGTDTTVGTVWVLTFSAANTISSGTFSFNPMTVTTSANFSSVVPGVPMADGQYTVNLKYKRASDSLVFSSASVILSSSTHTLKPLLTSPAANSFVNSSFLFKGVLTGVPSLAAGANPTLKFAHGSDTTLVNLNTTRTDSFYINTKDIASSSSIITSAVPNTLAEGTYDVVLTYSDASGHPPASAINYSVTVDTSIAPPIITAPRNDSMVRPPLTLNFILPETAKDSSVKIVFENTSLSDTMQLSATAATSYSLSVNPDNLSATNYFIKSNVNTLGQAHYTYKIFYQDRAGNSAMAQSSFYLITDSVTMAPVLTSPVSGSNSVGTASVAFTLPEAALPNSVRLVFSGCSSNTITLNAAAAGNYNYTFGSNNITQAAGVVSATSDTLPSCVYTVSLAYQDALGNPVAVSSSANYTFIKSIAAKPVLTAPASGGNSISTIPVAFTLPKDALASSVTLDILGCSNNSIIINAQAAGDYSYTLDGTNLASSTGVVSATSNTLPSGVYGIVLSYMDTDGNARMYDLVKNYTFMNSVTGLQFEKLKGYMLQMKTHLQWETATEQDLARFDVEYSKDSKTFIKVGEVKARGNSFVKQDYTFIHNNPAVAKNFYRLRMIDANGGFRYSPVITVYAEKGASEFRVYPNPTQDQLNVLIVTNDAEKVHVINVWGMDGKLVKTFQVKAGNGSSLFSFSMKELGTGNYVMQDGNNVTLFAKQ